MIVKNKEDQFQEEMRLLDTLKEFFFLEFNRENLVKYLKTLNELRQIIRQYQILVLELGEKDRITAMKEFGKYRHLEETNKIH
ncbi:MAG TPA: hypothetical protein P5262_04070 [Candidatus Moranbacteria bacterium]|nr:hypothetical protein [Candidatus Moranbacteria bacterium]